MYFLRVREISIMHLMSNGEKNFTVMFRSWLIYYLFAQPLCDFSFPSIFPCFYSFFLFLSFFSKLYPYHFFCIYLFNLIFWKREIKKDAINYFSSIKRYNNNGTSLSITFLINVYEKFSCLSPNTRCTTYLSTKI